MFNKRISLFTGHFGSGKTEVAVNYASELSRTNDNVSIVDFDIINPFFRTADAKEALEGMGIQVILPLYANTNVDIPALPAEINSLFEDKSRKVVFDVGGDDLGAKAVSRYKEDILNDSFEMYFVINTRRPMTDTADKIVEMIRVIEESARIKVSSLVNNTNLLEQTTGWDIEEGHRIITEVSQRTNIPVSFACAMADVSGDLEAMLGIPVLRMNKFIRLPWDK